MSTVEKIATKVIELFGSKENALKECQDADFAQFNSNFQEEKEILLYEEGCSYQKKGIQKGWWCDAAGSFSIKRDTYGTLCLCWAEATEQCNELYTLLGGLREKFVNIEVNRDFGMTLSKGQYVTYNAPYGIGQRYYDIRCQVGSELWVSCLYNQVNLRITGVSELEFRLPMYSWLRRIIPTNLGSNRRDGHSSFSWNNSFSIEKLKNVIVINGGEKAFTLSGGKLKSKMDIELENAIAKAPKGVPFLKGNDDSYGTTVTLGLNKTTLLSLFNATVLTGQDTEKIARDYSGVSKCEWRSDKNSVGFPIDANKISCIMTCWESQQDDSEPQMWWSFYGKEYVILGYKRSYMLLKELGGVIPEFLKKYEPLYPKSGNGWKLLN